VSIRAGDLGALIHNRAEVPLLPYRPLPPLEMTIAAGSIQSFQRGTQIEKMLHRIRHFDESGAEWRNLTPWCYTEHWGRRSLDSEPQQSRSPSVSIPAPASARDDDSGRQHTVISKRDTN